jgi:hypothetical protein
MPSSNLILDMPSSEYHGEKNSYSSSQLKTMLQDPEIFYKKYITKEIEKEESSAFDVGTYFHCAILEPDKLEAECAIYPGSIRRGKDWEEFKKLHDGKAILNSSGLIEANVLIGAVKESPIALKLLKDSSVEVSAFIDVYVFNDEIYTEIAKKTHILTIEGWVETELIGIAMLTDFATKIRLKVRADSIRIGSGVISDLKSTRGNCKDEHSIKQKVADYDYDLSASLYLDVFTAATNTVYHSFFWIFSSKDFGNSKTWIASEKNKKVGRAKWKKAILLLAKCIENDWTFEDSIGECGPTFYNELNYLNN